MGSASSGRDRGQNLVKAVEAWGDDCPEWIRTLANAADRSGQRTVAEKIGRSAGYVSRILSRTYPGRYDEAETLVRAAFGAEHVRCPAIGDDIPLAGCVRNRRREGPARNQLQQLFQRNCPRCPVNTDHPGDRM